jgi:TPR repeat protein
VRQTRQLIPAAIFLTMLLSVAAQSVAPAGVDPALLARAGAGDAAAQVAVGEQYARAAAGQGNIAGEMHLAALYRDGANNTIPRDMQQAAAWYRKAADQGDPTAQGTLGVLYSIGQGVPRDDVEAYFWLDLAASVKGPNQEKYAANRQAIGERITADELSDAQDRVAAWKAAHPRADSSH